MGRVIRDVIDYEILLMLDPELADERQNEIIARVRENIERAGGNWNGDDVWGRRRLAYEIGHKAEGVYHLLTFQAEPEALEEVSRVLKITDGVMRHMATRRPTRTSPQRPLETRAEQRQDSEEQTSPVG
jgi:small subunit ribosomal protein S6